MNDLHISTPPAGGSQLPSDSLWTRFLAPSAEDVLSTTPPSTSRDTGWGRRHNDHRRRNPNRNRNRNRPFYSPTGET